LFLYKKKIFSFCLESLDTALHEREVSKFEIESLKEQNEQLFQQYEREKSFHKEYQQVICFLIFYDMK
jgi:cell shape-determining protein MreC